MGDHRWRGYEHPELYEMINAGPGARASDPQTKYWEGLSEKLASVDEDLNNRLEKLGAGWEGKAAESATTGLTPLAQWATDAQTGSSVMSASTQLQGDYISDARANMPEPVKVTTPAPSGWDIAAAGAGMVTGNPGPAIQVAAQAADREAEEAAQADAEDKAVQTMVTYEDSSTSNADTLGEFHAPPDVVVSTPPPAGGGGVGAVSLPGTNNAALALNGAQTTDTSSVPQIGGGGGGTPHTGPQLPPSGGTSPQQGQLPPYQNPGPIGPGPINGGPKPPPNQGPTPPPWGLPGNGPGEGPGRGGGPRGGGRTVSPFSGGGAADEAARRGGLRGGMPGMGLDGENARSNALGRGMVGGMAGENGVLGRGGAGAGAGAGRGGVGGPMGAGGRRADGDDDDEHFSPDYLLETEEVFGDDRRVAPTVIGEVAPKK